MEADLKEELALHLKTLRVDRRPTHRGIMLLTAFLGSLMMNGGSLKSDDQDYFELLFWITHNGDGTLITPEHRKK